LLATVITFEVPVTEALAMSVAVMVWLPLIFSVAEKVPIPFVSGEFGGRTASASLLVNWTVPA
jgi:hypothetical protein